MAESRRPAVGPRLEVQLPQPTCLGPVVLGPLVSGRLPQASGPQASAGGREICRRESRMSVTPIPDDQIFLRAGGSPKANQNGLACRATMGCLSLTVHIFSKHAQRARLAQRARYAQHAKHAQRAKAPMAHVRAASAPHASFSTSCVFSTFSRFSRLSRFCSEQMDSRSRTRARTSSESGQAAVEYILILAIIVIIALSVVWQFSTAFRSYSDKLFDGYIACLLETGELPGSTLCSSETSG